MTTIKEINDNIETAKRHLMKFGKLMIEKNKMKMEKNKMKMMTKDEAEKAAKEFAWEKFEDGLYVQKIIHGSIISIYYTKSLMQFDGKSFPFVDLVPGDVCLVWLAGTSDRDMRIFSHLSDDGKPVLVEYVYSIGNKSCGRIYTKYRKLGFNVLEIVKGWGDE